MFKILSLRSKAAILIISIFLSTKTFSQPVVTLTPRITGLTAPIELDTAGDGTGRIFIVHKLTVPAQAAISVYDQAYNFLGTFLTITGINTDGEQGLLSMAFHPNYESNGFFYVYYTNSSGNLELDRYQVSSNPNVADPSTRQVVITISHPGQSNHNGGTLNFGNDGYLYFAPGDGGSAGDPPNNAQNPTVLLGKMLRINVTTGATGPFYTIPPDNPWAGVQTPIDTADEIWSFGLRNPFRWSFDRQTFDTWIGDVGQGSWEEINFKAAGTTRGINYGWRCYEGNAPFNLSGCGPITNYTFPIHQYPNPGGAAVTGGTVYRGTLYPVLQGYYFAADFYSGNIYKIIPNGVGGWNVAVQGSSVTGIADFGSTENGELYAVSLTGGIVYQISASPGLPVTLREFSARLQDGFVQLNWKSSFEQSLSQFEIEYSADGNNFSFAGQVQARDLPTGADYNFLHDPPEYRNIYYRLKMIDRDGSFSYSRIVGLRLEQNPGVSVAPSVVTGKQFWIHSGEPIELAELISTNGVVLKKISAGNQQRSLLFESGYLPPGVYLVKVRTVTRVSTSKIIVP